MGISTISTFKRDIFVVISGQNEKPFSFKSIDLKSSLSKIL